MNLLKETLECLEKNGKTIADIEWIGCADFKVDTNDFLILADTNYDNDYGAQEVAHDLLIVGKDWWMKRGEYYGAEWWDFMSKPEKVCRTIELKALTINQVNPSAVGWESLYEMNVKIEEG